MPNVWVEAENFETEVPEPLREHYEQQSDGRWKYAAADAEDVSALKRAQERVKEERNKLRDELRKARSETEGLDMELVQKLLKDHQAAEAKKAADGGDMEKAFEARTKAMREQHENQLREEKERREAAEKKLSKEVLVGGVTREASALSVKSEALPYLLARAKEVFRFQDGEYTAFGDDGEPVYNADGAKQTFADFVASAKKSAPSLFTPSTGGGAPSTSRSAAGGAPADMTNVRGLAKMRLARQS